MNAPRQNMPRTFVSSPWTDKALSYIAEVTSSRSRAALLTPATAALLVSVVSELERGGVESDPALLARGRDLLKEFSRLNPVVAVVRDV